MRLTPVPNHLIRCGGLTNIPKKDLVKPATIRRLVVKLRRSELRHSRCRTQAIAYYERARARLAQAQ